MEASPRIESGVLEPQAPNDVPSQAKKLDLSHLSPPKPLEELRLEEVTIDGICGVY